MGSFSFTTTRDLAAALGATMNLINPAVEHHHEQVGYLSFLLARELGMGKEDYLVTVSAALMHDVGALFTEEQSSSLDFEVSPGTVAFIGANMMSDLPFFDQVGEVVRYCQRPWRTRSFLPPLDVEQPLSSAVIHLADRAVLLFKPDVPVLNQLDDIVSLVEQGSGSEFDPDVVEAFRSLARLECVWMDLLYHPRMLMSMIPEEPVTLEQTVDLTRVMTRIIDYRSSFTAMHSAGVSASAVRLAELIGMSEEECLMMRIAGNLHDLGKIRTPRAILEKPGKLTAREFNVIKEHAYYTHSVLSRVRGFELICDWAALHHEKLDGTGYPFHYVAKQLPLGSRIMAVADIFSAITEERPYRTGMSREQTISVMRENVARGAISDTVVDVLLDNFDDVNDCRAEASEAEGQRYLRSIRNS